MRHFLVVCSAAVALLAMSGQKAAAWNKFNFNVGLNISHEAAENNFLWGAFRNGPHPCAQGCCPGGNCPGIGDGFHGPYPYYNPPLPAQGAAPTLPAPMQSVPAQAAPAPGGQASLQQTGYYYPVTSYRYPTPSYNYNYNYNYVPYYWYGR
jgi:hypothetical protein